MQASVAANRSTHWRLETDADGIAWLALDKAGASANSLSRDVMEELAAMLARQSHSTPPKALIVTSAKRGFIAGADIKEFAGIRTPDEAYALIRQGQQVLDRLAALPCPTVAAIHGFALGGGLEVALACRYRVLVDDPARRSACRKCSSAFTRDSAAPCAPCSSSARRRDGPDADRSIDPPEAGAGAGPGGPPRAARRNSTPPRKQVALEAAARRAARHSCSACSNWAPVRPIARRPDALAGREAGAAPSTTLPRTPSSSCGSATAARASTLTRRKRARSRSCYARRRRAIWCACSSCRIDLKSGWQGWRASPSSTCTSSVPA